MSNAIAFKTKTERRIADAAATATQGASDAKVDALVAELREVRASVGMLLRASDLAVLKSHRNAA